METRGKILLVAFVLFFGANAYSATTDVCQIADDTPTSGSCSGFFGCSKQFSVSATDNAHAALDPETYANKVWCPFLKSVKAASCTSTDSSPALGFSSTEDAHVESPGLGNYPETVCGTIGIFQETYCYTLDECPSDFTGIASISGELVGTGTIVGETDTAEERQVTNAHIARYGFYTGPNSAQVCCGTRALATAQATSCAISGPGSIEEGTTGDYTVACSDAGGNPAACDPALLNWTTGNTAIAGTADDALGFTEPIMGESPGSTTVDVAYTGASGFSCSKGIEVTAQSACTTDNLVGNPGFEEPGAENENPTGWATVANTSDDGTDSDAYADSFSYRVKEVQAPGTWDGITYRVFNVEPGEYYLSGAMKSNIVFPVTGRCIIDVEEVLFGGGSGQQLAVIQKSGELPQNEWVTKSTTVDVPTGVDSVRVRVYADSSPTEGFSGTCKFDNIHFGKTCGGVGECTPGEVTEACSCDGTIISDGYCCTEGPSGEACEEVLPNECENAGGTCSASCSTGEDDIGLSCGTGSTDACCVASNPCNNNGVCEAGENASNCPLDCGGESGNNLASISIESDKEEYAGEEARMTVGVTKRADGMDSAQVSLRGVSQRTGEEITLSKTSMTFTFSGGAGSTETDTLTVDTQELAPGTYRITSTITLTSPETDSVVSDNTDSVTIIVKQGGTVAAPEIHPVFIVFVLLGILMILKRN